VNTNPEAELDERISRIVSTLLREGRADAWMDAQSAADHLRMSRHHFLRLCRNREGPDGHGQGRLKRWRRSTPPMLDHISDDVRRLGQITASIFR
jgi:hypothetical protein